MRWTRWMTVAVALGAVVMMMAARPFGGSQGKDAPPSHAERIERGRIMSRVAGCNDCHTPGTFYGAPDSTRLLSGSELGWEGPWGVTYPRNLTPDMETGIGSWTEKQIVTAIRTGQRPDKSPLLPPMPWPWYADMPDEDAYALAAYLKSIPPVRHRAPDRQLTGAPATGPRLTFPPPPAWDGQHLATGSPVAADAHRAR